MIFFVRFLFVFSGGYSFHVFGTHIDTFGLALKHIDNGKVVIAQNKNLCFASYINWSLIQTSSTVGNKIKENMPRRRCGKYDAYRFSNPSNAEATFVQSTRTQRFLKSI